MSPGHGVTDVSTCGIQSKIRDLYKVSKMDLLYRTWVSLKIFIRRHNNISTDNGFKMKYWYWHQMNISTDTKKQIYKFTNLKVHTANNRTGVCRCCSFLVNESNSVSNYWLLYLLCSHDPIADNIYFPMNRTMNYSNIHQPQHLNHWHLKLITLIILRQYNIVDEKWRWLKMDWKIKYDEMNDEWWKKEQSSLPSSNTVPTKLGREAKHALRWQELRQASDEKLNDSNSRALQKNRGGYLDQVLLWKEWVCSSDRREEFLSNIYYSRSFSEAKYSF